MLLEWLEGRYACSDAREWVAANPNASVATCPRGDWLLWLAERLGYSEEKCVQAVRPAVLRAMHVYVPDALDAEGLDGHAARLRALPDDADLEACASVARAATRAAWVRATAVQSQCVAESAYWAGRAVRSARAADWTAAQSATWVAEWAPWAAPSARVAEHACCADDVRAAFPDLQARLDEVLG